MRRSSLVLPLVALVLVLPAVTSGANAAAGFIFVVDSAADLGDAIPGNDVCADSTGACTLRAAIAESNANSGFTDTIHFALPAGSSRIQPGSELPLITDPVVIDGTTQPGFVDEPIVELIGKNTAGGSRGLRIRAAATVVRGLVVNGFAVQVAIGEPAAGDGVRIVGNYLGTDVTGASAAGRPTGIGIHVRGGSDHVIGGPSTADRNVISGNGLSAIAIDFGSGKITIQGNYIGTNATGDAAVADVPDTAVGNGIYSTTPAQVVVGGDAPGAGNVISGNQGVGVNLFGGSGHVIVGNRIGTDRTGATAVPNAVGVETEMSAKGSVEIRNNVVSGNIGTGIHLRSDLGSTIQGNMVGVDVDGLDALPNGDGIYLTSTDGVLIGGTTAAERNVISGNGRPSGGFGSGIHFFNFPERNTIQGNYIGVGADGHTKLGNTGTGIFCCGLPGNEGHNVVGGLVAGAGNVIAFNGFYGISSPNPFVLGPQVSILGNSIFANGNLGIGLGPGGPTLNDSKDVDVGPNDLQNFPVIQGVASVGGQTVATVSLDSTPDVDFHLELFRNAACNAPPPSFPWFFGEGQTLVATKEVHTDAAGMWSGTVVMPSDVDPTDVITSTATRFVEPGTSLAGATSEFSECLTVAGATIVVEKETLPDNSPHAFDFTGAITASLHDGESAITTVVPGAYTVSEAVPLGWDSTSVHCADPSSDSTDSSVRVGPGGTATATIRAAAGETVTCTFTNTQRGLVDLRKLTNGVPRPDLDIKFTLYETRNNPLKLDGDVALETRTTLGSSAGLLSFQTRLVPGTTYTICEDPVPAGWTSLWTIGISQPGRIVTPYNPNALDTPPEDVGLRCFNFTVTPGETARFEVRNDFPGGDPRTIGYWKNWNRCTGGGQAGNAARNGGAAAGFFLVEDVLPQLIGDLTVSSCQQAVKLLAKQDQAGKAKASDAAYELGAQLLAARFNLAAGARACSAVQGAVLDGQALLGQLDFTGSGDYLGSKSKDARRAAAWSLASSLDRYNNGNLC